MKTLKSLKSLILLLLLSCPLMAQDKVVWGSSENLREVSTVDEFHEVAVGDGFHRAVLKAARLHIKSSSDKSQARKDALRLRVAMLLPGVRKHVKELVQLQIGINVLAGLDSDAIPMVDGNPDYASVDWEKLLVFLQQMIPYIIELLRIIGG